MPSGSYKQIEVQCPFYKYDDGKQRITCEGLVDNSSLALIYQKKGDYEAQINVFCCEHYKKCEVYRMLMESKYDEEV
jgi:hypothetical protein